jgi:Spy/CpxP family protein refolding chaperone
MTLAVAGLWAALGWAQPMRGHESWSQHGTPLRVLLNAAGASEEQKTQIKAIVDAHRPELRELHSQLRAAHQTLNDLLLTGGDPSASLQKIAEARAQLLATTVKMRQDVLALLTPDQRAKVVQLKDQLRALKEERRNLLKGSAPSMP